MKCTIVQQTGIDDSNEMNCIIVPNNEILHRKWYAVLKILLDCSFSRHKLHLIKSS